ncbi:hypothetical protein [Rhodococcus qingshengii]|uniref:hypothetical protein n=1 Tax=Rhodococcus qingshengii TaxID=334542 RepID=UPI001AE0210A|nr:hypothetical protein [Rhodococcus qingshengii]MCQ4150259.1 hypothetical protein [Rhodococcus qingshengii]
MANPAQLLHEALKEWDPRGAVRSASDIRVMQNQDGIARVIRAVGYLSEIGELLSAMEAAGRNTGLYRRRYQNWTAMVLSYPDGWNSRASAFDQGDLDTLEALIEVIGSLVPVASQRERSSISDLVTEILEALREDTQMPNELKAHLFAVAEHCRRCIDEYEILGDFALRQAVDRLYAELARAEASGATDSTWRDRFSRFWTRAGMPLLMSGATTAIEQGVSLALES